MADGVLNDGNKASELRIGRFAFFSILC